MDTPKHSVLGVASFCVSLLTAATIFAGIVIATFMEMSTPDGIDETSPVAIVVGLVIIGGIFVSILSMVLGFVSCFQRDRIKVFGILGAILGGLTAFATLAIMIIGLVMP